MDDLAQAVQHAQGRAQRWSGVMVVSQAAESADTPEQSAVKWQRIYRLFGANGEGAQDEVFAAVNAYFLRNGASPAGRYSKPIRTAGGVSVDAGEVVKITGRLDGELRQFLRGRLEDSYLLLKHNAAFREDDQLAAVAENVGVPRDYAWLLADWLGKDCPYFVGEESMFYNKLRASKIALARTRRAAATPGDDLVVERAPERVAVTQREVGGNDLF